MQKVYEKEGYTVNWDGSSVFTLIDDAGKVVDEVTSEGIDNAEKAGEFARSWLQSFLKNIGIKHHWYTK